MARAFPRPRRRWLGLGAAAFVVLAVAWAAPSGVRAQEPSPARTASVEELEALVQTIEDERQRQALVTQLRALIEARRGISPEPRAETLGATMITAVTEGAREIGDQLVAVAAALSDLPVLVTWLRGQATDAEARAVWLGLLFDLVVVVAVALAVERAAGMALGRPRRALEHRAAEGRLARLVMAVARALLELIPLALFVAVAYGALPLLRSTPKVQVVTLTVVAAYVLVRLILVAARLVLVPWVPGLRLLPLEDETATYLYIWVRRLAAVSVTGYFAAEAALVLGLPAGGHAGLLRLVGLVAAAMGVVFILQNRTQVARWIRSVRAGAEGRAGMRAFRERLADLWHVLAILYVVAFYGVSALGIEGGFAFLVRATVASAAILVVAFLASVGLRRLIDRGFAINDEIKRRLPGLEARANRYLPVIHVVLRTLIVIVAGLAFLGAWGLDPLAWIETPLGRRVAGSLVSIATVLLGALIIWEVVTAALERYLRGATDAEGRLVERSARVRTFLPLLRNVLFLVLTVMVVLIVLSELGINIAPLLAGAGVVGLAVGFGSQKLVQDVITGAFILFEDGIAVGDVVSVAGQSGLVEAMSVRSVRLRDQAGAVHTIPFSSVTTVTNMTKDFSYYVMDVGIAYREDTDQVVQVLRKILDEMRDDPAYAHFILEPLDVLGVDSFADSAVIIKARIKTRPIRQWVVGREFNRRMKKRFDEVGIEIPFPHRTIYFGEDKAGRAPPARVAMTGTPAGSVAPPTPAADAAAEADADAETEANPANSTPRR